MASMMFDFVKVYHFVILFHNWCWT